MWSIGNLIRHIISNLATHHFFSFSLTTQHNTNSKICENEWTVWMRENERVRNRKNCLYFHSQHSLGRPILSHFMLRFLPSSRQNFLLDLTKILRDKQAHLGNVPEGCNFNSVSKNFHTFFHLSAYLYWLQFWILDMIHDSKAWSLLQFIGNDYTTHSNRFYFYKIKFWEIQ